MHTSTPTAGRPGILSIYDRPVRSATTAGVPPVRDAATRRRTERVVERKRHGEDGLAERIRLDARGRVNIGLQRLLHNVGVDTEQLRQASDALRFLAKLCHAWRGARIRTAGTTRATRWISERVPVPVTVTVPPPPPQRSVRPAVVRTEIKVERALAKLLHGRCVQDNVCRGGHDRVRRLPRAVALLVPQ